MMNAASRRPGVRADIPGRYRQTLRLERGDIQRLLQHPGTRFRLDPRESLPRTRQTGRPGTAGAGTGSRALAPGQIGCCNRFLRPSGTAGTEWRGRSNKQAEFVRGQFDIDLGFWREKARRRLDEGRRRAGQGSGGQRRVIVPAPLSQMSCRSVVTVWLHGTWWTSSTVSVAAKVPAIPL